MKARSGASKQIASYAIRHIRATRWLALKAAILNLHELNRNKLFLNRTRKDSNFKRPPIYATLFQIENCCPERQPVDPREGSRGLLPDRACRRTGHEVHPREGTWPH